MCAPQAPGASTATGSLRKARKCGCSSEDLEWGRRGTERAVIAGGPLGQAFLTFFGLVSGHPVALRLPVAFLRRGNGLSGTDLTKTLWSTRNYATLAFDCSVETPCPSLSCALKPLPRGQRLPSALRSSSSTSSHHPRISSSCITNSSPVVAITAIAIIFPHGTNLRLAWASATWRQSFSMDP